MISRIRPLIVLLPWLVLATGCGSCVERAPGGGKAAGESCLSSSECLAGLRCVDGLCAQPAGDAGVADAAGLDAAQQDSAGADLVAPPDASGPDRAPVDSSGGPDAQAADTATGTDGSGGPDASAPDSASPPDAAVGLDVDTSQCSPVLSPTSLDLGTVLVGSTASLSAAVVNQGSGPCVLTAIAIAPAASPLVVDEPSALPVVLQPLLSGGQVRTIRLHYAPTSAGALSATVTLHVDGATGGTLSFSVTATASPPPGGACVSFSSSVLDFGTLPVGCSATREVLVINNCTATRRVASATLVGNPVFSVATATPVDIQPGSTAAIAVQVLGDAGGMASARLTAALDGGGSVPGSVDVIADFASSVVDSATQGGDEPVDLFIVVDDSGSMDPAQAQLARDLAALLDELNTLGVDYHIGVTTTTTDDVPAGQFIPLSESEPVITSSSLPDPATRLTAAVTPGIAGSGYEMGFDATVAALSLPLSAGRNAGLLRPEALLAVLYLSNEDDQSAILASDMLTFVRGLKAHLGPDAVSVGALVSFEGDTCATATDPGVRYLDLVEQASGVSASICASDWTPMLRELVRVGAGRRAVFFLSSAAQAAPEVWVDSALASVGVDYVYDDTIQAVIFVPGQLPAPGQTVTLSYTATCP